MNWFNYVVKAQKSKQNKARSKGQSTSCSPFFCFFCLCYYKVHITPSDPAGISCGCLVGQPFQKAQGAVVSIKGILLTGFRKTFCCDTAATGTILDSNQVAGERGNPAVSHSQWDNKQGGKRKDELSRKGESAHAQSRKRQWNYTDRRRSPGCEA